MKKTNDFIKKQSKSVEPENLCTGSVSSSKWGQAGLCVILLELSVPKRVPRIDSGLERPSGFRHQCKLGPVWSVQESREVTRTRFGDTQA